MKNDFWIYCKAKECLELVIDIYDHKYMEQSYEERLSELNTLLSPEIMSIKRVHVQWQYSGYMLDFRASSNSIERIGEIHHLLENAYTWLTPWYEKNPVFAKGTFVLNEIYDNSRIPHYKRQR